MTDLVRKQVVAVIDSRTTMVCLHAAGMITEVGVPFETLAGDFLEPPFHIHCRSIVRPWMSGFLSETRREANEERQRRPLSQRRLGPNGEIGARIPPAYDWNMPTDYSFPGSADASRNRPRPETGVEFNVTPPPALRPAAPAMWRLLVDNISPEVLAAIIERMDALLFSPEEAEDAWALLLDLIKVLGSIVSLSQLTWILRRMLGL